MGPRYPQLLAARLELPGHNAECWLGYALCLSALNEPEDADRAYRKAMEMDDRYSDAVVSYAISLADTGRGSRSAKPDVRQTG